MDVQGADGAQDASRLGAPYEAFLASKIASAPRVGFDVRDYFASHLFPFQRDIVRWALARGRAAIFADTGLGKTPMQIEWARNVAAFTGGDVLILAPLAVSSQTQREGRKFGTKIALARTAADLQPGINVTNYERLHHFDPSRFAGIVLDESSILKGFDGAMRRQITDFARSIHYRLACTATPAPNDLIELTNHAEFLDVMSGKEILALFFVQDGNTTHAWRLKGHAREAFWRWMASWSVAIRKPSDLGYDDGAFLLPPLEIAPTVIKTKATGGTLFPMAATSLADVRAAQRGSLAERVAACAALVNGEPNEPWLVWCNLNAESEALAKAIPGAVEVRGSMSIEEKETAILGFVNGDIRVMVSKPTLAGFGLNLQHCARMAFVGLSYSFEQYYQAIRRCWRFGQARPVQCHVVTADTEGAVVAAIQEKERQAMEMMDEIVQRMAGLQLDGQTRNVMRYREDIAAGPDWTLHLGDNVKALPQIESDSVGLTVTSVPFPGMYAYTNSPHDMGNVKSLGEMVEHFRFLIPELLRVTMPGRHCCIHLTQGVAFKGTDGYIGIKDFRGSIITAMESAGWIYYGEAAIEKDPQVKAIRTKDRGLLFKSLANDAANMHMALCDYLLDFRKPGDNPKPIRAGISEKYDNPNGWVTSEDWIEWASGIWKRATTAFRGGIRETDVLNAGEARDENDEKHLCPLQLGVIERAVKLWSAPGDLVLDPFAGIGSTGYIALRFNRRFLGCELKQSYWQTAVRNLTRALGDRDQRGLFSGSAA
ncbi:MAG: helicase [Dehalococcoidia bacterium]|nr:MAG: helicase [Dehalococcoidia bacterium]